MPLPFGSLPWGPMSRRRNRRGRPSANGGADAALHDVDAAQADRVERVVPDPDRPGAWYVRIGPSEQSHVDPDHPEVLEFDYMQRIAEAIDAYAPAGQRLRVVHVGGAGMTLPRYVAATRPTSAQVVLEPDVGLTEEVRAKVPLPRRSGIKVRPVDGRAGIAAMPDDYADVIVLDAFNEARVPGALVTVEFLADVARVLAPDGLFLANITDAGTLDWARRAAAGVRDTWTHAVVSAEPSTWRGRRFGNLVVHGSHAPIPVGPLARAAASAAFAYRLVDGDELDRWLTGVRPFTDAYAHDSPPPPAVFLGGGK